MLDACTFLEHASGGAFSIGATVHWIRGSEQCSSTPSLAWSDAYATTVFALGGADGLDWLSQFPGYEGLALWGDGRLDHTSGLRAEFLGSEPVA